MTESVATKYDMRSLRDELKSDIDELSASFWKGRLAIAVWMTGLIIVLRFIK
jgi:hypothetical protein